jgi:hypothetical protein
MYMRLEDLVPKRFRRQRRLKQYALVIETPTGWYYFNRLGIKESTAKGWTRTINEGTYTTPSITEARKYIKRVFENYDTENISIKLIG